MRFCSTDLEPTAAGEWVAISGAFGAEPAQLIFTAEQIEFPDSPADLPSVLGRLDQSEIAAVAEAVEQARFLSPSIESIIANFDPGIALHGVRPLLSSATLVCRCSGGDETFAEVLARTLSEQLTVPVEIEWMAESSTSYGSVGRLRSEPANFDAEVRRRLGLDDAGDRATCRFPYLGAVIQTEHGPGVLLSISMRHQHATIRLDSGNEVTLSLNDLP
jgi:hypothetical protein